MAEDGGTAAPRRAGAGRAAAGPRSLRRSLLLIGAVAAGLTVFSISLVVRANPGFELLVAAYVLVGSATVAAGLVAWSRRPSNGMGALLTAAGFVTLTVAAGNAADPLLSMAGAILAEAPIGTLLHLVVAFPSGRVTGRWPRALVAAGYVSTIGLQVPQALFRGGPLALPARPDVVRAFDLLQAGLGDATLLAAAVLVVVRLRSREHTSAERRVLAGVYAYGIGTMLFLPLSAHLARIADLTANTRFAMQLSVYVALPLVFAAGIFRGGFARTGEIEELGAWLGAGDGRRPRLRDALAESLGDPSLRLLFRREGQDGHVDADGHPAALPEPGAWQAAVGIDGRDGEAAVIVYDGTLIADPQLVRAAGRVVSLALDRERLTAELIASRDDVRRSRARIVEFADAERRRFAHDLHDLLQSRLVLAALRAGALAATDDAKPEAREAAERLRHELDAAITDLRGLVQGVMPALLIERGLFVAAEELVDRVPLPAEVEVDDAGRALPQVVAGTGYFILTEALSNVVKHSGGTHVRVRLRRAEDVLTIEVRDDGVGGAAIGTGAGLRGLGDRVDAHGGRLTIDSPPGRGTRIHVELPCGR